MFLLCVSVHGGRGAPSRVGGPLVQSGGPLSRVGAPHVKSNGPLSRSGGPQVNLQVKVWGPPSQGQGLGGPPKSTFGGPPGQGLGVAGAPSQGPGQGLRAPQVKVRVKVRGPPGQGPKRPGVGSMPLAVTQEDCLVLTEVSVLVNCKLNVSEIELYF